MGKGKQWTLAEDTALAEAWVHVAENAQQDDPQDKSDTFWGSVHDQWIERLGGSQRTQQALKNHWTSIQRAVRKFGGYAQLTLEQFKQEEEDPSGAGNSDAVAAETKTLALQKYLASEGEGFELEAVWEILRKSTKWHSSKTPGSALKRSRAASGVSSNCTLKTTSKRLSLLTNGGSTTPVSSVAESAAAAAVVAAVSADVRSDAAVSTSKHHHPAKQLSLSDAALATPAMKATQVANASVADSRLSQPEPPTSRTPITRAPAPAPAPPSSSSTSVPSSSGSSNSNVIVLDASPSQTAYSTSVLRLADSHREKNEVFADQMLQTLILANTPETKPSAEKDNYAASISKLADAQLEKNELVADQMLMTMLLADSADPANRRALEQLKDKYLKRAFQKTSNQASEAQGAPGLISATAVDI